MKCFRIMGLILSAIAILGYSMASDAKLDPAVYDIFTHVDPIPVYLEDESVIRVASIQFHDRGILFTDYNFIYDLDTVSHVLKRYGRDTYTPFTACKDITRLEDGSLVMGELITGIAHVMKYDPAGRLLVQKRHHPRVMKIVVAPGGDILVGGLHMVGYDQMLEKYDEDTMTPSKESIHGVEQYMAEETGFWIVRLDTDLNPMDSLIATQGDLDPKQSAAFRNMFSFDVDRDNSIWTFVYPDPWISHLDEQGNPISQFRLEPEDVNLPAMDQSNRSWRRKAKTSHWDYTLDSLGDKLVISYKTRYPDREERTRTVAVYTKDGRFVKRQQIPYRLQRIGDALYFWQVENNQHTLVRCRL